FRHLDVARCWRGQVRCPVCFGLVIDLWLSLIRYRCCSWADPYLECHHWWHWCFHHCI
ncbi:hypothetical protein BGZ94_005666, partial [Podila epigama]